MTLIRIGCIVEGHGDVDSVPTVIQRIAQRETPSHVVHAETYVRRGRGSLVQRRNLEQAVEFAARKVAGSGGILIVIDADDDCPATLGPEMQVWASAARRDLPVSVVLAMREFEAWFVAAAESLSGRRNLPDSLAPPPRPEAFGTPRVG